MSHDIRILDAAAARAALPALVGILVDCVNGGASVGFMNPFGPANAHPWWEDVIAEVEAGRTVLFGAIAEGDIAGTAQLVPATKPNQPHRADVSKLLVHTKARGRGIGAALMQAVEGEARRRGLRLLVLDTATGSDAERFYPRLGWERTGVIPDYALWPDGGLCDTTVFYKRLPAADAGDAI
ncbi:MAG: GNAT family N-acetyltransferase [Burkholderiales bacterium]|nr:GNAT family N-acetyltransferase [Burkholderiales bacterium]